jgi:hypothetical protein
MEPVASIPITVLETIRLNGFYSLKIISFEIISSKLVPDEYK